MAQNKNIAEISELLDISQVRETLIAAADAAASHTLPHFRTGTAIDNKLDKGFDPVTQADRGAEKAIRAVIAETFPDHSIIGEEWQAKTTDSPFSWIIDPVDGTRAFIAGVPVWGTLIGVTYKRYAFAGLMSQPFTGETYIALNGIAELHHRGATTPLKARTTKALSKATLFTTTPSLFSAPGQREAFDAVEALVQLSRYGCDCYAYALLAAGQIDLVIEPRMNTYDIAALVPLIESAGGVISTWAGERPEAGGDIIAAATPELRDAALEIMRQYVVI